MSERTPLQIAHNVWKALFLREASVRLFGTRAAYMWLLFEPTLHLAFISFLFAVIRQNSVGGIHIVLWLVIGLVGFFTFRRTTAQTSGAIDSNRALFTYRQVLPFDVLIIRGVLEGLVMLMTLVLAGFGLWMFGFAIVPEDPLTFMAALFGLWLLGMALGLILAVASELAPEVQRVFGIIMLPMYFASGVIFPLTIVPPRYLEILMWNPIPNGLEAARSAFASFYHAPTGTSLSYLYLSVLCLFMLGTLLYWRFTRTVFAQ